MFNIHFVKNIIYRDFVISLKEKEKRETTRAVEKMSRQNLERIKINCEILNKKKYVQLHFTYIVQSKFCHYIYIVIPYYQNLILVRRCNVQLKT